LTPTERPAWKKLAALATQLREKPLVALIEEPQRATQYSVSVAGCLFDFSKQWVDRDVMSELLNLAEQCQVLQSAQAMFAGHKINASEDRPVLHSALRGGAPAAGADIIAAVTECRARLVDCAESIRSGNWRGYTNKAITDIVHIGIGGSHLGPELVVEALADYKNSHLRLHFVANIDANALSPVLRELNPETTLFVVVSKSFGTLETQVNALSARSWFLERTANSAAISKHFIGVTSNTAAALAFGLAEENLFPLWDWVGGRFSLWSAVGLPILLSIGAEQFDELLRGAQEVDQHFASAEAHQNVPLLSALFATWNANFLGAASLAVLSYDERLHLLPDYLQQLEMESNGKSVTKDGKPVAWHTMPILWGGTGTKGQHAYHQLLHQGTRAYAADFILVATDDRDMPEHHNWLLANALAQSQAMAIGSTAPKHEPHKNVSGNHSTTTIVLDRLAPRQIGGLLAVYEHKVFCQGILWDINSFDQWGVELGKLLAEPIYAELAAPTQAIKQNMDAVTQNLLRHLQTINKEDTA
jgi:glucose-6-phosphate isomerase